MQNALGWVKPVFIASSNKSLQALELFVGLFMVCFKDAKLCFQQAIMSNNCTQNLVLQLPQTLMVFPLPRLPPQTLMMFPLLRLPPQTLMVFLLLRFPPQTLLLFSLLRFLPQTLLLFTRLLYEASSLLHLTCQLSRWQILSERGTV
jgi:hypothetical protein